MPQDYSLTALHRDKDGNATYVFGLADGVTGRKEIYGDNNTPALAANIALNEINREIAQIVHQSNGEYIDDDTLGRIIIETNKKVTAIFEDCNYHPVTTLQLFVVIRDKNGNKKLLSVLVGHDSFEINPSEDIPGFRKGSKKTTPDLGPRAVIVGENSGLNSQNQRVYTAKNPYPGKFFIGRKIYEESPLLFEIQERRFGPDQTVTIAQATDGLSNLGYKFDPETKEKTGWDNEKFWLRLRRYWAGESGAWHESVANMRSSAEDYPLFPSSPEEMLKIFDPFYFNQKHGLDDTAVQILQVR
jgi:hypothetical protein